MPVTALKATKIVCRATDWSLSNLHVQKILYLAHMSMLHRTGGKNGIVDGEPFQAWDYGPVIPKVYHELKIFGSKPVTNIFRRVDLSDVEPSERELLESFAKHLATVDPGRLIRATHRPEGAWDTCYQVGRNRNIPNALIFQEAEHLYALSHRS